MTITDKSKLPETMSDQECFQARKIIAKKIEEQYDGFKEPYDIDVCCLFEYISGTGKSPSAYKEFMQWLALLMLRPKNAKALKKKFGSNGPSYFEKLIDFFMGMEENGAKQLLDWLTWRDFKDTTFDSPPERVRSLWKEFVNPG